MWKSALSRISLAICSRRRQLAWLSIEGVKCDRDAIGARIRWTIGGKTHSMLKNNGCSYLSSHDPRVVLGIGRARKIEELEIHWPAPSKQVDKLTDLPLNRYVHIVEGTGILAV